VAKNEVPFVICYTKSDKLKKANVDDQIASIKNELLKSWEVLPDQFVTSAEEKLGKEEILNFIDQLIINP
jgi:GTP-binding protein